MARNTEHTEQQKSKLLDALRATLGVVETACKAADIGRTTHYDWLKRDRKYAAKVADIDNVAIDFGETQLIKLMRGYSLPDSKVFLNRDNMQPIVVPIQKHVGPDASAVIFFLKTRGKKRGYVERNEVTGKDGAPVVPGAVNLSVQVLTAGPPLASSEKEVDDAL